MGNHEESSQSPTPAGAVTTSSRIKHHHQSILCPRCGYDLRGITQTWDENGVCPFTGKCSECGLGFDWYRVFRESEHPWLFEYHWRQHGFRSLIRTASATLRPARFWCDVHLYDIVHIRPLLIVPVILGLFVILTASVVTMILKFDNWNTWGPGPFGLKMNVIINNPLSYSREFLLAVPYTIGLLLVYLHGIMAWWITMPALFLVLPVTLREARVRTRHLIRVTCYSILVPLVLIQVGVLLIPIDWMIEGSQGRVLSWIDPWSWIWDWLYYGLRNFDELPGNAVVSFIFAVWWSIWWAYVDRNYLRLQNWLIVWLCQITISVIVTVHILLFMNQFGSHWILDFIYWY